MSWREAIVEALKTAAKPMSSLEIVQEIKQRGLRSVTGNTPEATVGAVIYTSLKKYGEFSPFVQVDQNRFAYDPSAKAAGDSLKSSVTESGDEEDSVKSVRIIRAFGMFWKRDFVSWKSSPKILGFSLKKSGTAMDFCGQLGVYFLHDGTQLVYVGRSLQRPLGTRLYEHTIDRLNGRWDRFSWFGLLDMSDEGKVKAQSLKEVTANGIDLIVTLEALLIEGMEPKQNRKCGDNQFRDSEYVQVEDPDIAEKKIKNVVLQKLLN